VECVPAVFWLGQLCGVVGDCNLPPPDAVPAQHISTQCQIHCYVVDIIIYSSTLIYLCVLGFFVVTVEPTGIIFFLNSTSVLPQHVSKDGTKRHIDLGLGLL